MNYRKIDPSEMDVLWELQKQYKAEIGEEEPDGGGRGRLAEAIGSGRIVFYGAWDNAVLAGCCSVTVGFCV